ncbi:transposase, partial [Aliikangiella maris]
MPRPLRIEYEDAYYHVMSRGRDKGRRNIFHSEKFYTAFLETLAEACERFEIVVHALMTNHYHLLVQTPLGNLGRAMRHINGVYTQRHNRLKNTDGPLFRGRYKSILVEKDSYLLQLSRYIHRNPIETKRPMVTQLENYPWSSYPAYVNQVESEDWLEREQVYQMLGNKQ